MTKIIIKKIFFLFITDEKDTLFVGNANLVSKYKLKNCTNLCSEVFLESLYE